MKKRSFFIGLLALMFALVLTEPARASVLDSLTQFRNHLLTSGPTLLSPQEAYQLNVSALNAKTLAADFKVAKGYYLYKNRTHFVLRNAAGVTIKDVRWPAAATHTDQYFGTQPVYYQPFQVLIDLDRPGQPAQKLTLQVSYQGCSLSGVCYPPQNRSFNLTLPGNGTSSVAQSSVPAGAPPSAALTLTDKLSDMSYIGGLLQSSSFWLVLVSFFGFGLLLAFSPCMLPMLPILSGIIVGKGAEVQRMRGLSLSAAYVLGMAVAYAAAGVAAALTGTLLSTALQNPWVLGAFALLFVLLALSMYGLYEVQMPSFIQSRLTQTSNRICGRTFVSLFGMGAISAVIVGPCLAAPLAGALLFMGQTHNLWLGGAALFTFALGMGLPLLLLGASAGFLLPRAGPWMASVRKIFGWILLATALWIVSPVVPATVLMLLIALLFILAAVNLRVIDPLPPDAHGLYRVGKGLGVVALLVGGIYLVGVISGGTDLLHPLDRLGHPAVAQPAANTLFTPVKNVADLDRSIQNASGRYVMLDFYADWCVSCKELDRYTFSNARVQSRLKDVVLLRADVTANSPADQALLKRFGLYGPPGIIFFDRTGREILGRRVIGFQDAATFLKTLDRVLP